MTDYSPFCEDQASALEQRLWERADRERRYLRDHPPEPDYETDWDRILELGCEIERVNHGCGDDIHATRRPGDDPRTADLRDGIEPAAAPDMLRLSA